MRRSQAPTSYRISTPLGRDLMIVGNGFEIVASDFIGQKRGGEPEPGDALLRETAAQVRAYFDRRLRRFDVPLERRGTPFQSAVWAVVAELSFGEFVSYADVARAIGRPLSHRGVAAAMGQTPFDLLIPAHRVVGADGRVRGFDPRSVRARLVAFERA